MFGKIKKENTIDKETQTLENAVVVTEPKVTSFNQTSGNFDEKERSYNKFANVDWKRVSQEKVFKVMAEIMLENKRIYQDCDRLNRELEQSYNDIHSKDKSKDVLEAVAIKVAPSLISSINAGKKYSPVEMQEYIINEVLTNKKKYMDKILEQNERIKSYKELVDELQSQYYDLVEEHNKLKASKESESNAEAKEESFTIKEFEENIASNIPEEKPQREAKAIMKVIPLEKARELFCSEECLAIAKILGEQGYSEFPLIQQEAKKYGISENRFETLISNMEKEDIVEVIKVTTFQRNTGLRLISLKDEVGTMLYKEVFKKEPVKSEMEIIRAENDNYEHGYSIKDTLNVLKENYGFEDVSMSRKTNTIHISSGDAKVWIPDIIGVNPITKKKEYFEVEMGTYTNDDFAYKLDKALYTTNELKIITSNKIQADRILGKVKAWYNQKKSKPTMVIKIYTYVEFKRKENGRMWPTEIEDKTQIVTETVLKDLESKTKNVAQKNDDVNHQFEQKQHHNNKKHNKFKNNTQNPKPNNQSPTVEEVKPNTFKVTSTKEVNKEDDV